MAIILVSEIIRRILPYTKFTELLLNYFYKSIETERRTVREGTWQVWREWCDELCELSRG